MTMRQITVEAYEDESRPQGGHAVILLHGLEQAPDRPAFRLRPVDAVVAGADRRGQRARTLAPLATRKTHQGIELLVGPEVVANPQLLSGTPVIIEVPEAGVRGEFLWPSVRPLAPPRRRHVVVSKRPREMIAPAPEPIADEEAEAEAAPEIAPLDTEALARLLGELPGEPIAVDAAQPKPAAPAANGHDHTAAAEPDEDHDAAAEIPTPRMAEAAPPAMPPEPAPEAAAAAIAEPTMPPPRPDVATDMKWVATRDPLAVARKWAAPAFVASFALLGFGLYSIAGRYMGKTDELGIAVPAAPPRTAAPAAPKTTVPAAPRAASGSGASGNGGPGSTGTGGAGPRGDGAGGGGAAVTAAAVPPAAVKPEPCTEAAITTEPLSGGRMHIGITSTCRAGQAVTIAYGGAELVRALDAGGRLDMALDLFAGAGVAAEVKFADGGRRSLATAAKDLERVSKVAVLWRAPVDLDLHAFEYAARDNEHGHVFAARPSSLETAEKDMRAEHRGRGFLSVSDRSAPAGDRLEVYTFVHAEEQSGGVVPLAVDYVSRGGVATDPMCGKATLAEVPFRLVMRLRNGQVTRHAGTIAAAECGARIEAAARLNPSTLPALQIRK